MQMRWHTMPAMSIMAAQMPENTTFSVKYDRRPASEETSDLT